MANQKEYRRLPGQNSLFFVGERSRLYLGKDHLLRVTSNGWTESYRRFYYTDIQAVVVRVTHWIWIWSLIHGALCIVFVLFLLADDDTGDRVIHGSIAGFFGALFLFNLFAGTTCETQIQTRVGTETLPSLKRLPKTRRALGMLQFEIDAVQGQLNPADMARIPADAPGQSFV